MSPGRSTSGRAGYGRPCPAPCGRATGRRRGVGRGGRRRRRRRRACTVRAGRCPTGSRRSVEVEPREVESEVAVHFDHRGVHRHGSRAEHGCAGLQSFGDRRSLHGWGHVPVIEDTAGHPVERAVPNARGPPLIPPVRSPCRGSSPTRGYVSDQRVVVSPADQYRSTRDFVAASGRVRIYSLQLSTELGSQNRVIAGGCPVR